MLCSAMDSGVKFSCSALTLRRIPARIFVSHASSSHRRTVKAPSNILHPPDLPYLHTSPVQILTFCHPRLLSVLHRSRDDFHRRIVGGDCSFPLPRMKSELLVRRFAPASPRQFPTVPKRLGSTDEEQYYYIVQVTSPSSCSDVTSLHPFLREAKEWQKGYLSKSKAFLLMVSIPSFETLTNFNCQTKGHLSKSKVSLLMVSIRAVFSQAASKEIRIFSVESESLQLRRAIFSGSEVTTELVLLRSESMDCVSKSHCKVTNYLYYASIANGLLTHLSILGKGLDSLSFYHVYIVLIYFVATSSANKVVVNLALYALSSFVSNSLE